jgi:uncharacterized protein
VIAYLDSSAGVKLLAEEVESDALATYLNDVVAEGGSVVSGWLFETEVRRAATRLGIAQSSVTSVLDRIDLAALDRSVFAEAGLLPGDTLRSLDAVHIVTALRLGADMFVSYDTRQTAAADAVGLRTDSPA